MQSQIVSCYRFSKRPSVQNWNHTLTRKLYGPKEFPMTGTLYDPALEELTSGGIKTPEQFKTVGQVTALHTRIR